MLETDIKIVGVKFTNPDKTSRQERLKKAYDDFFTEGRDSLLKIKLVPEPKNEYDPNAVAVFFESPKVCVGQIGYIPRDNAPMVRDAIVQKRLQSVRVKDMAVGKGGGTVGLTLALKIASGPGDTGIQTVKDEDGNEFELGDV